MDPDSSNRNGKPMSDFVSRFFKGKKDDVSKQMEEEVKNIVEEGSESGLLDNAQKTMIDNVFEFDDRTVSEIMTHRTDCVAVNVEGTLQDVLDLALTHGYSRIPVYKDDIDDIVGVLYVKDLLILLTQDEEKRSGFKIENFMRKAVFVPFSRRCIDLFSDFTEQRIQMAIVVDEYGGTFGVVTMEDLLESIVGNMQDEYDHEDQEITQIDEDTYEIGGWVSIDEVERLFGVDLIGEDGEEFDSDTVGGLLIEIMGRIPVPGENPKVEVCGLEFQVMDSTDKCIELVRGKKQRLQLFADDETGKEGPSEPPVRKGI